MDIAALSMSLSQQKILSDVGTAMLSKSLDLYQDVGNQVAANIAAMPGPSLESLANPAIGGNIDIAI